MNANQGAPGNASKYTGFKRDLRKVMNVNWHSPTERELQKVDPVTPKAVTHGAQGDGNNEEKTAILVQYSTSSVVCLS